MFETGLFNFPQPQESPSEKPKCTSHGSCDPLNAFIPQTTSGVSKTEAAVKVFLWEAQAWIT